MDKWREALLPFCRNLMFRKHRSKLHCKKKKKLWLIFILFIFDLCAAYEVTKADRNPLTVYEALLNQQLCNIKQESKYSHRMLKKITNSNMSFSSMCAAIRPT